VGLGGGRGKGGERHLSPWPAAVACCRGPLTYLLSWQHPHRIRALRGTSGRRQEHGFIGAGKPPVRPGDNIAPVAGNRRGPSVQLRRGHCPGSCVGGWGTRTERAHKRTHEDCGDGERGASGSNGGGRHDAVWCLVWRHLGRSSEVRGKGGVGLAILPLVTGRGAG